MPLQITDKTFHYSLAGGERITGHFLRDKHTGEITFTLMGMVKKYQDQPVHDISQLLMAAGGDFIHHLKELAKIEEAKSKQS